ncbi:hypothetical protein Tco_1322487 [Tanacetum coccineum]
MYKPSSGVAAHLRHPLHKSSSNVSLNSTKDDKEFTVVKILAILLGSKKESQFGPLRGEQAAIELPRDWVLNSRSTQCSGIHYLLDEEIHIGLLEEQVKQHNKKREAVTSEGKGPKDDDDESYEVNIDENFLTALGYRMPPALGMTYTTYPRLDELKDHCLTLKNTLSPLQ